jgi:hypothetical protein
VIGFGYFRTHAGFARDLGAGLYDEPAAHSGKPKPRSVPLSANPLHGEV